MPFNGSGTFDTYTPGNPVVTGTTVSSTAFNNTTADFSTGLSNAMTRDGQSPATSNIPMGGNKITGLAAGTANGNSVRYEQLIDGAQQATHISAVAAGTADAITGSFTPAIAALPAAPGTLHVLVRAGFANATTTPTFKADGTTAKTIVKGNNLPLSVGDISGSGAWIELQYDATLDKWVLLNPANAVRQPSAFSAYASAVTSIPNNLFTKVNFQTESWDTDNLFASSRFTADRAGIYHFDAEISLPTSTGALVPAFYKNGALHKRGSGIQVTSTGQQANASADISLAVGDYVEVYAFQITSGAINTVTGEDTTYFDGHFIRPM